MAAIVGIYDLFTVQSVLVKPIVTVGLTLFLFGLYVMLFGQSCYFLLTRRDAKNRRLQLAWISSLFVVTTATSFVMTASDIIDAVVSFNALKSEDLSIFLNYGVYDPLKTGIIGVIYIGYVVTNCIADSVLIYRIYVIWGSRKRNIVLPTIASVAANGLGISAAVMKILSSDMRKASNFSIYQNAIEPQKSYWPVITAVNVLLTCFIAGRIWWVARDTRRTTFSRSKSINPQFKTAIAIILESGFLYIAILIAQAVLVFNAAKIGVTVNLSPAVTLVAGIAPTLIILRVNLNHALHKGQPSERLSTLRFGVLSPERTEVPISIGPNTSAHVADTDSSELPIHVEAVSKCEKCGHALETRSISSSISPQSD